MTEGLKLYELSCGGEGVITAVAHGDKTMQMRLSELGFVNGARVKSVGRSPLGGMSSYFINGAVFALRDGDAAGISVRAVDKGRSAR